VPQAGPVEVGHSGSVVFIGEHSTIRYKFIMEIQSIDDVKVITDVILIVTVVVVKHLGKGTSDLERLATAVEVDEREDTGSGQEGRAGHRQVERVAEPRRRVDVCMLEDLAERSRPHRPVNRYIYRNERGWRHTPREDRYSSSKKKRKNYNFKTIFTSV